MKLNLDEKHQDVLFVWLLAAIVVVACFLRIPYLNTSSLCDDEAFTVYYASRPLIPFKTFLWGCINRNYYPPLDFLLHHAVYAVAGVDHFTTRIVPCFFDVLSLLTLALAAYHLIGRRGAIFTALIFCFAPISIYYAKEARVYSHLGFAVALYLLSLSLVIKQQSIPRLIFVAFSIVYGFNVSLLFFFAIPPCVLTIFLYYFFQICFKNGERKALIKSLLAVAAAHLCAAILSVAIYQSYNVFKVVKTSTGNSLTNIYSAKDLFSRVLLRFRDCVYAPYVHRWCNVERKNFQLFLFFIPSFLLTLPTRKHFFIKLLLPAFVLAIPFYDIFVLYRGGMFQFDRDIRHVYWFIPAFFLGLGYCAEAAAVIFEFLVPKYKQTASVAAAVIVIALLFFLDKRSTASMRKAVQTVQKSNFHLVRDAINKETAKRKFYITDQVVDRTECRDLAYLKAITYPNSTNLIVEALKKGPGMDTPFTKPTLPPEQLQELAEGKAKLAFLCSKWMKFPYSPDVFQITKPSSTVNFYQLHDISPVLSPDRYNKYLEVLGNDFTNYWHGQVKEIEIKATLLSKEPLPQKDSTVWQPWRMDKDKMATKISFPSDKDYITVLNEGGEMHGLKQPVKVRSGQILRLSSQVRSRTLQKGKFLGARVFFLTPDKQEHQQVYLYQTGRWEDKQSVFTNTVDGTGLLVLHMGYTKDKAEGQFKDIKLEELTKVDSIIE